MTPPFILQTLFLAPMAKTKDGNYFLDANPLYFEEILEFLRYGKIDIKDEELLKGVKRLASYLGLRELFKEAESHDHESQWIILDVSREIEFEISVKAFTRFKNSTLAKYFLGDKAAKQLLSQWIKKESVNRYFIDRSVVIWELLIRFMKEEQGCEHNLKNKSAIYVESLIKELDLFGFKDYYIPPRQIINEYSTLRTTLKKYDHIEWK